MLHAARELFGVDVDVDALAPGETALRQGRELGLAGPDLPRWCTRVGERYVELLARADTTNWQAPDGVEATLREVAAVAKPALLTGNPEPMARARMERLGLACFFAPGEGAFGCESEGRTRLIELARELSDGWPAQATVAAGGTPRGVAGGHAVRICDCFTPSAFRIAARLSRSARICFSIASWIVAGGSIAFSSTRFTRTPHFPVASSRTPRSWLLIWSREVSVSSRDMPPTTLRSVVTVSCSIAWM